MISIVTAYYNRKKLFTNTLKSIANSQFKNVEIIAVDDASDQEERLEDLTDVYPNLKVIRLEKENKWYINPCVPFNIGFKEAKGEIIVIQNPECYHYNDILSYTNDNLKESDYFSFSCYSIDRETTENYNGEIIEFRGQCFGRDGDHAWYNHSGYRPAAYHFCSAIYKQHLDELGGFDERFAHGIAFDDDDLITRIHRKGLNVKIIDTHTVLHQWHYKTSNYSVENSRDLIQRNRSLFNTIKGESHWKSNQ